MRTPIFQLDAFTTRRFAGNPAAVVRLGRFLPDAELQAVAAENNLSETAFLVPEGGEGGNYRLRWFTPAAEVPLCGHATLASAAVVMERLEPGRRRVVFHTASGPLTVERTDVSRYFAPAKGIPEDPVTGAAHCMLAPYWARRLGKTEFRAFQASRRGGEVLCRLAGDRVELEGSCVFYLEGEV